MARKECLEDESELIRVLFQQLENVQIKPKSRKVIEKNKREYVSRLREILSEHVTIQETGKSMLITLCM